MVRLGSAVGDLFFSLISNIRRHGEKITYREKRGRVQMTIFITK